MQTCYRKSNFPVLLFLIFFAIISPKLMLSANLRPLDDPRQINDDTGSAVQSRPALALNLYGWLAACWTDARNGNNDIYAQIVTAKGIFPQGNFRVNDETGSTAQSNPAIAMNLQGNFVVVWEDERNGSQEIYAQLYQCNGQPIGENFCVSQNIPGNSHRNPVVAMDAQGDFVVCWSANSGSQVLLYFQRFDRFGNSLGNSIPVSAAGSFLQFDPAIAMTPTGEFVIVWCESLSPAVYDIMGRRFAADGSPRGTKFEVSTHPDQNSWTYSPTVSIQADGSFIVFWDYVPDRVHHQIYGRAYQSDGVPCGDLFNASSLTSNAQNQSPHTCVGFTNTYFLMWSMNSGSRWEAGLRYFDKTGSIGSPLSKVVSPGNIRHPKIRLDGRFNMIFIWEDDQNGNDDIFANWNGQKIPMNLTAPSGFNGMVPLTWEPSFGFDESINYDIYRREEIEGTFHKIGTADILSRGPFKNLMLDWLDTTAENGKTYWYRVAAAGENVDAASFEAPATPRAAGHIVMSGRIPEEPASATATKPTLQAGPSYIAPEIDGVIQASEWQWATAMNIANPVAQQPVMLYLLNNRTHLFLAVDDPNDFYINPQNLLGIIFDLNNDDAWDTGSPSTEGAITINATSAWFTGYRGEYPNHLAADTPVPAAGIDYAISTSSGHVQYEVAINLETSPLKAHSTQTIGAAFWVQDPGNFYPWHYGNTGEWPAGTLWECAQTLGDLTLPMMMAYFVTFDWPMHNGNPSRDSFMRCEWELCPPFQKSFDYPVAGKAAELSFRDEVLYVAVNGPDALNRLYAFPYESDTPDWIYEISGFPDEFVTTPTVLDSIVVFGGTNCQGLYAVDRQTGNEVWHNRVGALFNQHPIFWGEHIYVATDSLMELNSQNGEILNSFGIAQMDGSPVLGYNSILCHGDEKIYALDYQLQEIQWQVPNLGSTLAVGSFCVYSWDTDGKIVCRNIFTGDLMWEYVNINLRPIQFQDIITVSDTAVCFVVWTTTTENAAIYTLNRNNGTYRWHHDFNGKGVLTPTLANGVVYVVELNDDANNSLWAFNVNTGHVLLNDKTRNYTSQPIVAHNRLIVGATDQVVAFWNSTTDVPVENSSNLPVHFSLSQNFPNPFNPTTHIHFQLPRREKVRLVLLNLLGQEVRTIAHGDFEAGAHTLKFEANSLSSGVYFYRLEAGDFVAVRKLLLMK